MHPKTTAAMAACREALHALEAESHARRRHWSAAQAIPRHTACVSLRGVIAAMESERIPVPDDAEGDATKRFLREQMSLCDCSTPKECPRCELIANMLAKLGYWSEHVTIPASEPPVEGTRTVTDSSAARRLVVVGGGLVDHGRSRS